MREKNLGNARKFAAGSLPLLLVLSLLLVVVLFATPVSACSYTVGTFESDYETPKDSFFKGEIVYGNGTADVNKDLKLRIRDPDNVEVYCSNVSQEVVYGSYFLNSSAKTGEWDIQLGVRYGCYWNWVKTSHFTVSDANFTLTVNVDGNGSVVKYPDLPSYTFGSVVNLSAVSDPGWSFNHWSGDLNGSDNPGSIVMDSNKSITAHFVQDQYNLTINIVGSGTVDKNPDQTNYTHGTLVELTAIPNSGWNFDHWSGDLTGGNNSESINMTENRSVTAYFTETTSSGSGPPRVYYSGGVREPPANQPPIADLSAGELYLGFVGDDIHFNGTRSRDSDGYIIDYDWDFGDGSSGKGEVATHNYSSAGSYLVILTVTDNRGAKNTSETYAVIVEPNHPPSDPEVYGPSVGQINVNYTFTAVSSDDDNDMIKYIFEWGDGSINESRLQLSGKAFNVTHRWTKAGNYTIIVTADDNETISTTDLAIIIEEPEPLPPQEDNLILILLALLALILFLILLLLSKRKKDEEDKKKKK